MNIIHDTFEQEPRVSGTGQNQNNHPVERIHYIGI
jgi:hypothetical protein